MEVGLHNIARQLAARGHEPIVFAPAGNVRDLRRSATNLNYQVVPFPPKLSWLAQRHPVLAQLTLAAFFAWAGWRHRIDVWHGTMGYPIGTALARYAQGQSKPILVRCAGHDIQVDPSIDYGMRLDTRVDAMVRRWLPRVPALVAISESVAQEYRALGVPDERIIAIPNGVNLRRFREGTPSLELRQRLGIANDVVVFLSVARNHPKKNLSTLVEATSLLKGRVGVPEWAVVIVGSGVPALRDAVDRAGLTSHVRLIDEINITSEQNDGDLPARALVELYRSADVFVLPSLIETFGIVIVEAMAAGLPVIVGDSPGCRDVVDNGRHGLMFPPRDAAALGQAMALMLQDPAARSEYRQRSLNRAQDYDWGSVVDRYLEAYERLLEADTQGGRRIG